jgi:tetratricopeptide (TPR) repeat protein
LREEIDNTEKCRKMRTKISSNYLVRVNMFTRLLLFFILVFIFSAATCEALVNTNTDDVSSLLMQSRWTHEPESILRKAIIILDKQLDEDSKNIVSWKQLAEALSIGLVKSQHANSSTEAWRYIYELDSSDCHSGALATPFGENQIAEKQMWIKKLNQVHPECAEAIYLNALISKAGSAERSVLLKSSLSVRTSADAQILLAQELLMKEDFLESEKIFMQSLSSAPLFPEDWRPDGRVAVHAHLGLAWSLYSRKKISAAKREYKAFMEWFIDPGPWHDLSEAETRWQNILDNKFYKSVMKNR